jgi:pimeloyl-ACP methyl ester carboxylesterase
MKKIILAAAFVLSVSMVYSQASAIRVEKIGKGTPILFLPGFTTPGSVWKETINNLNGKYESHLVSYAGFDGLAPVEGPWYESVKTAILTYIKENKLTAINIVGHSMGGNLAVEIAAAIPDKIIRVVLVDSLPCMRELMMPGVPASQISYDNPYSKQLLNMSAEAFKQTSTMIAQSMTTTLDKVDTIASWSVKADRKTFVNGYTDLLKLDLRDVLEKITAKTLILGAPFPNKDIVMVNLEKQYAKLTNKTIEIATGGKHFIMFDQPQWFYEKLNSFLTK